MSIRISKFAFLLLIAALISPGIQAETVGVTTVGGIDYPNGGLVNAGRIPMQEDGFFTCGITNRAGTIGWFGTANYYNRATLFKIDLETLETLDTLVMDASFTPRGAAIDGAEEFGYFLVGSRPGRILKIDLEAMVLSDSLTLSEGEDFPSLAFTNPAGTVLYVGAGEVTTQVVRIDLETFQRTGSVTFPITEPFLSAGAGDLQGQFGYFATLLQGFPVRVVKVNLETMTRVGSLEVPGVARFRQGVLDPSGTLLYFCTYDEPAKLVRIHLDDFLEYKVLTLPMGLGRSESLMVNASGTKALIAFQDGSVARVDLLGDMTYEGLTPSVGLATPQPSTALRPQDSAEIGYFAHVSQPGTLTKHNISTNVRLGTRHLVSDQRLYTAVADHEGEFAYYGSRHPVARIVKIDLQNMERVDSIGLPDSEQQIVCSAIDGLDRFAYFGTLQGGADNRAELVKVDLDTFTRVGSIQTPPGFPGVFSIALDEFGAQAWIGSVDLPAGTRPVVARIDLNSFQQVGGWASLTLGPGGTPLAAVFNPADNNVYIGTNESPLKLFRVSADLTAFAQFNAPGGHNICRDLVLHPTNGKVYACNSGGSIAAFNTLLEGFTEVYGGSNLGMVYGGGFSPSVESGLFLSHRAMSKVEPSLALFPNPLVLPNISDLFGSKGIPGGEARGLVVSPEGDRAWYGIYDILSFVGRVNAFPRDQVKATRITVPTFAEVSSFSFYNHAGAGPRRSDGERLSRGVDGLACGAFDRPGGKAVFGTATFPGQLVKFDLDSMVQEATRTLEAGFDDLECAFMEPDGDRACFGTFTTPGNIIQVNTSDLGVQGSLILDPGEDNLSAAAVDPAGQFGYFASSNSPARIIKASLDPLARIEGLILNDGEDLPKCLVIDPSGEFAYVGCGTFPGRVVKIQLSDFTRVDSLTLEATEGSVRSGAIDPAGIFAYFGTDAFPAQIVKIRLSDFTKVEVLTLRPGEGSPTAMAMDPTGQRLVVALGSFPAKIATIDLESFTREGAFQLRENESAVTSAFAADLTGDYAYLGVGTSPARVVKIELAPKPLRVGIYGNSGAEKQLLWQSAAIPLSPSEEWIEVPVAQGEPGNLVLPPDEYWLAWQVDASTTAASYQPGVAEEGFSLYWPAGPFPENLIPGSTTAFTLTNDKWSSFITYDLAPTATPTQVSAPTPTPSRTPGGLVYDVKPDPIDGFINALDLIEWIARAKAPAGDPRLLFEFSLYYQQAVPPAGKGAENYE